MTDAQVYARATELYKEGKLTKEQVIQQVLDEAPVEWLAKIFTLFDITVDDLKESLRRHLDGI